MHMLPGIYVCIDVYVGIVHAAAVERIVWVYEVYLAQQTQPGPPHRESVPVLSRPPAKEGPRRR